MKLPEHITLSFLLAQFGLQQQYGFPGTALLLVAGCLPDLDGIGIVLGWRFYQRHHRILGHGILMTLIGPALLALVGVWLLGLDFFPLWAWCQVALLAHLATDVAFYRWPVQLLWPFTSHGLGFGLVGWNDLVPTLVLYSATLVALLWPAAAIIVAAFGIGGLVAYLLWRAVTPASQSGWSGWLAGNWTARVHRVWRWLTGDFLL
jgi:hypothetical protein